MKNELALNNSFDTDCSYAVLIDDICSLTINNCSSVNVFCINRKKNDEKRPDYIVGRLVEINDRPYFKPDCSDGLILLGSESAVFSVARFHGYESGPFFYSNYSAPYGEIKFTDIENAYRISGYFENYPKDYVTCDQNMDLVLNNPLCVNMQLIRKLDSLEDDGIWECLFNEEFGKDYARELFKKRLFAQKQLISSYVDIYKSAKGFDPDNTKAKRKELITILFGQRMWGNESRRIWF